MLLEAKDITKAYTLPGHPPIPILKGAELQVREGEMLSVVGASGSGKTTLLNVLGTLDTPEKGSIRFEGEELFGGGKYRLNPKALARFRNRKIGFVFQFHHLLSDFNAQENVAMAEYIATGRLKPAMEKAAELLVELGLGSRLEHLPSELSGGEQQRVAIARALMNQPKLVLADEPSGNLDAKNSQHLYELMARLSKERNTAFVIVTHNDDYALLSDRCLEMDQGLLGTRSP